MDCWDRQRKALAGKIDSGAAVVRCQFCHLTNALLWIPHLPFDVGTDVAGEMELFVDTLKECKTCHKAGVAAVEMLAVSIFIIPFLGLRLMGSCLFT
jgi:hypothetical protein